MKLAEIATPRGVLLVESKRKKKKRKAKKTPNMFSGFRTPVAYAGGWGVVAPGDNSGEGGDGGGGD